MAEQAVTPSYFEKWKGAKTYSGIPYPKWQIPLISGIGGILAIAALRVLSVDADVVACFIVPFGASCVLVFAAPAAPFSQPRNVIGGHFLSALIGVAIYQIFKEDNAFWMLAVANGLAIAAMAATKTIHPPAGATVFLPIIGCNTDFMWAVSPVALGAALIVVVGLVYNNVFKARTYPAFWW